MASKSLYKEQYACIKRALKTRSERQAWHWIHLLHGPRARERNLHGPGDKTWNIIIGHRDINGAMRKDIEEHAIIRTHFLNQTLWYEAKVEEYHSGAEFFAKTIRVRYGIYNPVTGVVGPVIHDQPYSSSKVPPKCPPTKLTPSAPHAAPAAPAPAPAAKPKPKAAPKPAADFTRKIEKMSFHLESSNFDVSRGGMKVTFNTRWTGTGCLPNEKFFVQLKRPRRFVSDDDMGPAVAVPVGKSITVKWGKLPDHDYYLELYTPFWHNRNCCLTGDLEFREYDAKPYRFRPGEMA